MYLLSIHVEVSAWWNLILKGNTRISAVCMVTSLCPQHHRLSLYGKNVWMDCIVILFADSFCREPRGFAFVEFVDPYDAADAQHRLNGEIFAGRRLAVVVASETRKKPQEMRHRNRNRRPARDGGQRGYRGRSRSRSLSRSRSPRAPSGSRARHHSRSYSPAPRRHKDYSVSPSERQRQELSISPRGPPRDIGEPEYKRENNQWRSSRSPSGSRSRSAFLVPEKVQSPQLSNSRFSLLYTPTETEEQKKKKKKEEEMAVGILEVLLLNAKGLGGTDLFNKIDPYVVIKYKSQEHKSSVARGEGGSPSWNEKFTFRAEYPGNSDQCSLTLIIMDKDTFSADDFIGKIAIPVGDLLALGVEKGTAQMRPTKYRVVRSDNSYCGEIQVGVSFNLKVEEECRGLEFGGWKQSEY
ncbi:hypothetical protein SAY87_009824 [Trapa incisa]|uniref:C2 domain-containing protein n=1 Tax=Trapa incisa TaxID=236973 RepID=A0AAN7K036_9MYRT|nr:hypothetical protein SAY87_009824 [Trapa incisa]